MNTTALDIEYRKVIPARFVTRKDGNPMHCVTCAAPLAMGAAFTGTNDFTSWHSYCATCASSAVAQIAGLVKRVEDLVAPLGDNVPQVVLDMVAAATPMIERAMGGDSASFLPAKSVLMGVREQVGAAKREVRRTATAIEPGLFLVGSEPWLVRMGKSGHPYAMRLGSDPTPGVKPEWVYVQGGMRVIRSADARRATPEEAGALGHLTTYCCFCGRHLTDDGENRSVEVGYGPVCGPKNGLPWG